MRSKLRITITAKILAILSVITIAAFVMGIYSFVAIKNGRKVAQDISNVYLDLYQYDNSLNSKIAEIRISFRDYVLSPSQDKYDNLKQLKTDAEDNLNKLETLLADKYKASIVPEITAIFPEYKEAVNTYLTAATHQVEVRNNIVPKEKEFIKAVDEFLTESENLRKTITNVIKNNIDNSEVTLRYFENYSRIATISVDTALVYEIFQTVRYTGNVEELAKIQKLMVEVNNELVTIKNNILMSIHCQGYFVIFSVFWVYDSIKKCAILKTMQKSTIREEKKMKLIIQIPCYNEADTLKIALDALPKQIDGIDSIEYLIINDGSKDNTVQVAKEWGVNYVVNFKRNKGLAKGFMAGLDACIRNGADIIVNTDADNQYNANDIEKLIRPIMEGRTDIVIGARPIDATEHWSLLKKKLQHLGSWVVRKASNTDIPDAPSGFRAYSRNAAMQMNVINEYTYTLETIVQAGRNKIAMESVPIRTNAELRPSRLFHSITSYVKRSMVTIIRAFLMYKPLKFFIWMGMIPFIIGIGIGMRFLYYFISGAAAGHVQSLILASMLILIGTMIFTVGLQADIIAANRKLLEDIQLRIKKMQYDKKEEE